MKNSNVTVIVYTLVIILISAVFFFTSKNGSFFSLTAPANSPTPTQSVINIPFQEKKYHLDFDQQFAHSVVNIGGFAEDVNWQGEFQIDDINYLEGSSSYSISSINNKPSVIFLEKPLDLSQMAIIKFFIFSEKEENGENIETFTLKFSDKKNTYSYEYSIPNIVKGGWNLIEMSKKKFIYKTGKEDTEKTQDNTGKKIGSNDLWKQIEKVTIILNSRPTSRVKFSFNSLWAEENQDYQNMFQTAGPDMISLKKYNKKTYLEILPFSGSSAFLKKISSVKNFTYTVKIIPQEKKGTIAIIARTDAATGYGYYLSLKGIDDSGWQLYKIGNSSKGILTTQLADGIIANFVLERNTPVWLRLKTDGSKITGYISLNGTNFIRLTERSDGELSSGGVGFMQGGSSFLIESIDFEQ